MFQEHPKTPWVHWVFLEPYFDRLKTFLERSENVLGHFCPLGILVPFI